MHPQACVQLVVLISMSYPACVVGALWGHGEGAARGSKDIKHLDEGLNVEELWDPLNLTASMPDSVPLPASPGWVQQIRHVHSQHACAPPPRPCHSAPQAHTLPHSLLSCMHAASLHWIGRSSWQPRGVCACVCVCV
jgi:hypothetical protein